MSQGPDLAGYVVHAIGFRLDSLVLNSPGRDPNGDGIWTDWSWQFTIFVLGELHPLDPLVALLDAAALSEREKRSLLASIEAIRASLDRADTRSASAQLKAFQAKVRAQIFRADPVLGAALVEAAAEVIASLGTAIDK